MTTYEIVTSEQHQYVIEHDDELLASFSVYLISGGFWGMRRIKDMQTILEPHFFYAPSTEDMAPLGLNLESDPEGYWKLKGIPNTKEYFDNNIERIADVYDSLVTDDSNMKNQFELRAHVLRGISDEDRNR